VLSPSRPYRPNNIVFIRRLKAEQKLLLQAVPVLEQMQMDQASLMKGKRLEDIRRRLKEIEIILTRAGL
jgi:hypothetical protein